MKSSSFKAVFSAFWDTFLPSNIVLVQAAGVAPILAIGYDLMHGVALSACTTAVLLPVGLCMTLLGDKPAAWLRPALYTLFSAVLLLGTAFVLRQYVSPDIYAHLYVFLPLMAVNTLFTYRVGNVRVGLRPAIAVADALGSALGFSLVLCVACAVREAAVYGTLWHIDLGYAARFPEAKHPFIGFVLLGFMSAVLQWVKQNMRRKGVNIPEPEVTTL